MSKRRRRWPASSRRCAGTAAARWSWSPTTRPWPAMPIPITRCATAGWPRWRCRSPIREDGRVTNWRDAIGMAGRELLRRPGRAVLTMVAVALATALLTALVAIASTGRTRVLDQITHGGALASISVAAAAPNPSEEGLDDPTPGRSEILTASAIQAMRHLPHVI